jgi:hypothetical protein
MRILKQLCRFVDWDTGRGAGVNAGGVSLLLGFLPWLVTIFALASNHSGNGSDPVASLFIDILDSRLVHVCRVAMVATIQSISHTQ